VSDEIATAAEQARVALDSRLSEIERTSSSSRYSVDRSDFERLNGDVERQRVADALREVETLSEGPLVTGCRENGRGFAMSTADHDDIVASRIRVIAETVQALQLDGYERNAIRELMPRSTMTGRVVARDAHHVGLQVGRGTFVVAPAPAGECSNGDRLTIEPGTQPSRMQDRERALRVER
jgi:hypothetical protein